jgi:quinol-cytochrome oxidoreductase complex cytochrome b subunit
MRRRVTNKLLEAFPIDIQDLYEKAGETLPHSAKRWWWCWGGIVGLIFGLQVATGLLLAFYYRAEPGTAYESIRYITEDARFGLFLRSVHNWGASFMVLFLFLHMLRTFVTASYRENRWGTWMAGVGLLGVTLGLAFTGYALVGDTVSYWAIVVTSNIVGAVPLIGGFSKQLFLAGDSFNQATLSRMYAFHVQIMPAALMGVVLVHLMFVRLHGMHKPGNAADLAAEEALTADKGTHEFFPNHAMSETASFLYVALIIMLLALAFPVAMGLPFDPAVTPEHIKPEWYFYAVFHILKLIPGQLGVVVTLLLGLALFFWPFIDQYILQPIDRALFKGRFETSLLVGMATLAVFLLWSVVESY